MDRVSVIFFLIFALSCNKSPTKNEAALAKVDGKHLYASDVYGEEVLTEDQPEISKDHIENWVIKQLWFKKSIKEVEAKESIENKVEDYRQSLYIQAYQDQILAQANLVVSDDMIIEFYKNHKEEYRLEEDRYKLQYVSLEGNELDLPELLTSLNENSEYPMLQNYCSSKPNNCLLNPLWVESDRLEWLGLPEYLWDKSVKFKQYYKGNDEICLYRILDERKKNDFIPLELVSNEIRDILFFEKKKETLLKVEKEIFINAQNKNNFEIYE